MTTMNFSNSPIPRLWPLVVATTLGLAGCVAEPAAEEISTGEAESATTYDDWSLDVFVEDNDAVKNSVVALHRKLDGSLRKVATFPTGGQGTGAGLGSQGSVVLSKNGRRLYVVNAGSNEISSFEVLPDVLVLRDIVSSGGANPVSLTVRGNLLYVVNGGRGTVAGNIAGFTVDAGRLTPIIGSTQMLSGAAVGPAQIDFAPSGRVLVVTEKATNSLTTFEVDGAGVASAAHVTSSNGQTPFGFAFDPRGTLIVSEAFGGAAGASAVSSYRLGASGAPVVVSGSVPTGQSAACWIALTDGGEFAYTTNTASNTISGYAVDHYGRLQRFADAGITATTGGGPTDADVGGGGRFLYALNSADDTISVMKIRFDGTLETRSTFTGLPPATVGLAAR